MTGKTPKSVDSASSTFQPVDSTWASSSRMAQDYLKTLWGGEESGKHGMSVNDLASAMGVVASTASENVSRLVANGLVTHEPYRKVHFTDEGRALAISMVRRHRLLETYLHDRLNFEWDEVHEEAEILEHAISDRLLAHIDEALGKPERDPHGDLIPREDGSVVERVIYPLVATSKKTPGAEAGKWYRVTRLSDEDSASLRVLDSEGIGLDALVRIVDIDQAGQVSLEIRQATAPIVGAGRSARLTGDVASIVMVSPLDD